MKSFLVITLVNIFAVLSVSAYTGFIGYGEGSCIKCHYNGFGNGPLNDYGRVMAATSLSGNHFVYDDVYDEELARSSGFLGARKMPKWLRPFVKYRGVQTTSNFDRNGRETTYTTIQADVGTTLRFGSKDQVIFTAMAGYQPKPRTDEDLELAEGLSEIVSREHYVRVSITDSLRLYTGFFDKVFGLRTVDFSSFARIETQTAQNDQVHGVALQYLHEKIELGLHAFAGDLKINSLFRHQGGSFKFEVLIDQETRFGGSAIFTKNRFINHDHQAIHARLGLGNGSSLLTEIGRTRLRNKSGKNKLIGMYGYVKGAVKLFRGFLFTNTLEILRDDIRQTGTSEIRLGPGFQYFPANRFEIRTDFINRRSFNDLSVTRDSWDLRAQVHLWL